MDNTPGWNGFGYWILVHLRAAVATVGLTGCGVGFVKFLRHAPAPRKGSVWAGCLFDTFQDLASNDSRIGERRDESGRAAASEPTPQYSSGPAPPPRQ